MDDGVVTDEPSAEPPMQAPMPTPTGAPVPVLVTFPGHLDDDQLARLRSVSPRVEVTVIGYDEPAATRSARGRGERPDPDAVVPISAELRAAYARAEVLLTFDLPLGIGAVAQDVRWVQAIGAGTEHFRGAGLGPEVVVTNAAGISAVPIAEFVMGRLLAVWKRFDELAALQRAHEWKPTYGRRVAGKTVVVVGFGAIGRAVAQRAHAFGMHVIAVRRRPDEEPCPAFVDRVVASTELLAVLPEAEAVVVAAPATAATHHLFDAAAFAAMPERSIFCNVARGTLVDEAALLAALTSGHLRAAVLDVTEQEPLPANHPLWDAPNLHLSPHCSTDPSNYVDDLLELFADNLGRYLRGAPLVNAVVPF
jgi:phosphoglycerate dehydrogenase-like enzyme